MRPSFSNHVTLALILSIPLGFPSHALAANYSPEVMKRCEQVVGQMKFEGWPADRNRDMMMNSCEMNGGQVPGAAPEGSPASLQHAHHPAAVHVHHG